MRVVVIEFVASATCEVTGRTGECVRVLMEPNAPVSTVKPSEFIKLLRFQSQQEVKRASLAAQPTAGRDREAQTKP